MALYIEQTFNNIDIIRYHRIGHFDFKENNVVTATLESYRTQEQRGIPFTSPLAQRYFTFILKDPEKLFEEAYEFIKKTPEFKDALQEEPKDIKIK